MNTKSVNSAADVILRALTQNRTAAGIALALESAQLLQSPETAAEDAHYRAAFEAQRSRAETLDGLLRTAQDRVAELEAAHVLVCRECAAPVRWVEDPNGGWWNHTRPASDAHSIVPKPAAASSVDSYPPALPWAKHLDHEDLTDFLDELAASAVTHASSEVALTEVEDTIGRWRAIGEAQHAHNTAPGPDAEGDCDHPNGYGPNGCAGCGVFRPTDDEDDDPARCLEIHPFSPRDGWRLVCSNCDHHKNAPCHEDGDAR